MTYSKTKYLVITKDYLVPVLLIALVLGVVYSLFYSSIFTVKNIVCELDYESCSVPHLLAEVKKLENQNIFLMNDDQVISRLISGNFQLRAGTLTKQLPGKVKLELSTVYPVLSIVQSGMPSFLTLDKDLRVIKFSEKNPNVPTLVVTQPLTFQIGQKLADPVLSSNAQAVQAIVTQIPGVTSIVLTDQNSLILTIQDSPRAVLTTNADLSRQINALQQVLSDATITVGVREIDVRFSQPILRSN